MEPDTWMPVARREDLVTTQSGEELLVYDQRRYHLHHLNPLAAAVWRACDGQRSVPAIAGMVSAALDVAVDPGAARLALTQLADADLLVTAPPAEQRVSRQSRRQVLRKAAAAGLALPAIASVTVPDAAAQTSCPPPMTACGEACIPTNSDINNCGGCGIVCSSPPFGFATCVEGECVSSCLPGMQLCQGGCVDISSNAQHCGACDNSCPPPANGVASCINSSCATFCLPDFIQCGGACVDTATDANNCGGCGISCGDGITCSAGICGQP